MGMWIFQINLRSAYGLHVPHFIVSVSCSVGLVLVWSWSWLGLALPWSWSWLGLDPSKSWSCLGLDTLWSWSWLGLGLGGLDYNTGWCAVDVIVIDRQFAQGPSLQTIIHHHPLGSGCIQLQLAWPTPGNKVRPLYFPSCPPLINPTMTVSSDNLSTSFWRLRWWAWFMSLIPGYMLHGVWLTIFPTERSRAAYVITLLSGSAREWGTAVWEVNEPECYDFTLFSACMKKVFDRSASGAEAAGLICPSSSPAGAGFFIVQTGKSLQPCIDYRGLNNITVHNKFPIPLISSAFSSLQSGHYFTKLDLRNGSRKGMNGR